MNSAVRFQVENQQLYLLYTPRDDDSWVHQKFKADEDLVIKKTFRLSKRYLITTNPQDNEEIDVDRPLHFCVASKSGEYFVFDENILVGVECPVKLSCDATPTWKWFTAERNVSILSVIARLKPPKIVIGGNDQDAIPISKYEGFIKQFPTNHEISLYIETSRRCS